MNIYIFIKNEDGRAMVMKARRKRRRRRRRRRRKRNRKRKRKRKRENKKRRKRRRKILTPSTTVTTAHIAPRTTQSMWDCRD